jgi:yecA family protein
MTAEEILAKFAATRNLPHEALRAAVTQAEAITPALLALAERVKRGVYLLPDEQNVLFYGLYALAAAKATPFYRALTDMLHADEDQLECILSDTLTEDLPAMLIGVFDGDPTPLYSLLEDRNAGSHVKWGIFDVLARLVHDGRVPRQPFVEFLDRFEREPLVDEDDAAWQGWQDAIGLLRVDELKQRVIDGWQSGRNDLAGEGDYDWWLEAYDTPPGGPDDKFLNQLGHRTTPFDDPAKALSWADFSDGEASKPGTLVDPGAATALSRGEIAWLTGFLTSGHVPGDALTMEMLDGFFTALAICNDDVPDDHWLTMVWSESQAKEPTFDSDEQEALVLELLGRHHDTVRAQLATGLPRNLLLTRWSVLPAAAAWCGGFLRAVALGSPSQVWQRIMMEEAGEIAFSAIVALGTGVIRLDDEDIELSGEDREKIIEKLPEVIADTYRITHPHAPARPGRAAMQRPGTYKRAGKKIGRNDPCPCGSGRKFKACCIAKHGETVN